MNAGGRGQRGGFRLGRWLASDCLLSRRDGDDRRRGADDRVRHGGSLTLRRLIG